MWLIMKIGIFTLCLSFLLLPSLAGAAGLVPECSGDTCTTCHAVALVNNVMNFLITALSIVAVGMFVYVGFQMVVSGGDTQAWTSAKKMFTDVVIGFLIVLAAWLIVDTVLKSLTKGGEMGGGGLEVWSSVLCEGEGG